MMGEDNHEEWFSIRAVKAEAEVARLRKALEKLASMEAITLPFYASSKSPACNELTARIDFARAALNKEQDQ